MVRSPQARRLVVAMTVAVAAGFLTLAGPSKADVTAVQGNAYGYFASVGLFGGPANTAGPAPTVTLPPGGSATPITASAPTASVSFGPARFFTSGLISVSTQGTTGATGSVSSSATIMGITNNSGEVFSATSAASSCNASQAGTTGATTIVGGMLQTDSGDDTAGDVHPAVVVALPANPAPNTTFNGHIHVNGAQDNFQYIFNEQTVNPDGSITVYAAHQRLLGPTAVGDLYIGKSVCGVTATASTSSTSGATSSTSGASTSSTSGATTSSTSAATTSTTAASTTTSTTAASTTTSTTAPATTTTVRATTTTLGSTTTTTIGQGTTTTTQPSSNPCVARLEVTRAQTNQQLDAARAQVLAQVPAGAQRDMLLAQIEASRAQSNAQINQAEGSCPV